MRLKLQGTLFSASRSCLFARIRLLVCGVEFVLSRPFGRLAAPLLQHVFSAVLKTRHSPSTISPSSIVSSRMRTVSQHSTTSPLPARFLTFLYAVMTSEQSWHRVNTQAACLTIHVMNAKSAATHFGMVASNALRMVLRCPSTTRFVLSPTPSDDDMGFCHSLGERLDRVLAIVPKDDGGLPRLFKKCTIISTLPQTQLATDPELQSTQLSNVRMSESPFLFMSEQSCCVTRISSSTRMTGWCGQ